MLTFIWAEDENQGIGYQGALPWHLPADLKHFQKLTWGQTILMGRKTFISLKKPLPSRYHLVLTHSNSLRKKYQDNKQVQIFSNLANLEKYLEQHGQQNIFVIGGASIFSLFSKRVDRLEKTKIHHVFTTDTFMPELPYQDFILNKEVTHPANKLNPYAFDFLTFNRQR